MNKLSNRLLSLAAVTTVAVLHSAGAIAAPKAGVPVFNDRAAANAAQLPALAKARSGVFGTLNAAALSASDLELTLADGRKVTARLERVAKDNAKGTQSWIGTFDDSPGSILVLTKTKGVVSGFATVGTETFEIVPRAGGKHLLYAVDGNKLPKISEPVKAPKSASDLTGSTDTSLAGTTVAAADSVVQDVLVVYTAASAAAYGATTLEGMITSAIESGNQAYLNSGVGITLNMVAVKQVAITEGATQYETLQKLQADSAVANLRQQYAADIVTIITQNSDNCGQAWLMTTVSTSSSSWAFGAINSGCLSNQSLAHEIGHIQGLMHDRESSSGWTPAYPYGYGYRVCTSDGTGFRDIMSYSCTGAPRVLLFSSPYKTYNGHAAGVAYETDALRSAENVRALNNSATTVAAFRTSTSASTSSVPTTPSGLAIQSVSYNQVRLGWADNSTNELGFKLERSSDGVNFAEIATLGAGVVSHVDPAVAARTSYYYRVRAYNGAGMSNASGTASVTTPDVPPPPPSAPTSVSSSNNANGSASISWVVGSTNASNYEVRRETYSANKGTWGGATTVATVPSAYTSIADTSGAGTFRYSVRATNLGGASAYAGPAQVTVTASTATTTAKRGKRR